MPVGLMKSSFFCIALSLGFADTSENTFQLTFDNLQTVIPL